MKLLNHKILNVKERVIPLRALIIDDEVYVRKGMVRALESKYLEVIGSVATSPQGLALLNQYDTDIVITDVKLYEGCEAGFKIMEEIAKQPLSRRPVVIMASASDGPNVISRALLDGADNFLVKPGEPEELFLISLEALDVRRSFWLHLQDQPFSEMVERQGLSNTPYDYFLNKYGANSICRYFVEQLSLKTILDVITTMPEEKSSRQNTLWVEPNLRFVIPLYPHFIDWIMKILLEYFSFYDSETVISLNVSEPKTVCISIQTEMWKKDQFKNICVTNSDINWACSLLKIIAGTLIIESKGLRLTVPTQNSTHHLISTSELANSAIKWGSRRQ